MQVLVTGAKGFIGSNLVDKLVGYGNYVYDVDIANSEDAYNKKNFPCGKLDVIFHLGAYSRVQQSDNLKHRVFDNNIAYLQKILDYAVQNKITVVFVSTSYCNVNKNANYYALSKHIGEELCMFYANKYDLNIKIARLSNVYGNVIIDYPEWKLGVVDLFIKNYLHNKGYHIHNSGEQTRDYIHVSDVVEGLINIGDSKVVTKDEKTIFEVSSGQTFSVNQIAKMVFGPQGPTLNRNVDGEIEHITPLGNQQLLKDERWEAKTKLPEYIHGIVGEREYCRLCNKAMLVNRNVGTVDGGSFVGFTGGYKSQYEEQYGQICLCDPCLKNLLEKPKIV